MSRTVIPPHHLHKPGIFIIGLLLLSWLLPGSYQEVNHVLAHSADVCGALPGNEVWDKSGGGVYTITCPVIVPAGVTLTIGAGVRVQFNNGHNFLHIYGELTVNGTLAEPVWFTSSQANPYPGIWDRIGFEPGSAGSIDHAIVEYGGYSTYASIQIEGGTVSIQNSNIRYSSQQGIRAKTWLNLVNNQFTANTKEALRLSSSEIKLLTTTITGNTGSGNGTDILYIDGYAPSALTLGENPGLPYGVEGTVTAPAGTALTIAPGARFAMGIAGQVSGALEVGGVLTAHGTLQRPIVFTSAADANGQGFPGDWYRIYVESGGNASLAFAQISYGGAATANLYVENASLTLNNVMVNESAGAGVYAKDSLLDIRNSVIHDNAQDGLLLVSESATFFPQPQIADNRFVRNGEKAVYLRLVSGGGGTLAAAGNTGWENGINGIVLNALRLKETTLAKNPGLPYVIESLTVDRQNTLWIEAGVVIKASISIPSPEGTLIEVLGSLVALGTNSSPVVFTSIYDCANGGVTTGRCPVYLPLITNPTYGEKIGALSSRVLASSRWDHPAPGDWRGIVVQPGGSVNLSHTIIQYGGYPDIGQLTVLSGTAEANHVVVRYGLNHGVYAEDASLTIRNSNLSHNRRNGLRIYGNQAYLQPVIQANTFTRNGDYAVYLILNGGGIGNGEFSGNAGHGNGLVNGIYLEGYVSDRTSRLHPNPGFPYVIWTLTVNPNAKLTIAPGVVVKFTSPPDGVGFTRGTGTAIILGELEAIGNADQPITFTSYWDDAAGGDTNGNFLGTSPQPGDWLGFIVRQSGQAILNYTEFRYGGSDGWNVWSDGGGIEMAHSTVFYSSGNGIGGTGMVTLSNNAIRHNLVNGIQINGPADIQWNTIADNGQYGLINYYNPEEIPDYRVPAMYNYWGSPTGPSNDGKPCPYELPTGAGNMVNCRVHWAPFLATPP